MLTNSGMQVTSEILDPADGYAETVVTNPAQPDRGTVRLGVGGALWWDFQLRDPSAAVDGLALPEIVAAIAQELSHLQSDHRRAA